MAGTTDARAPADLRVVHDWIATFFGCQDCRNHFLAMSANLVAGMGGADAAAATPPVVTTRAEAMLWLWQAHNTVSLRLGREQASNEAAEPYLYDPAAPKVLWPTAALCPACRLSCGGGGAPAALGGGPATLARVAADSLLWQPQASAWDPVQTLAFLSGYYDGGHDAPLASRGSVIGGCATAAQCTTATIEAGSSLVNSACCPPEGCKGVPTSCGASCAALFSPWWALCSVQWTAAVGGVRQPLGAEMAAFAVGCAVHHTTSGGGAH
jgi:hypothetical protein